MSSLTFHERPHLARLLLGLVFIIGVAAVVLAGSNTLPGRYDWMLGSVLFVTTLAWMGAAAFTGATAPMGNAALKYAYAVLLVFPIAFAVTGLQPLSQPVLVMLWAWMVLAGLVGALAPHDISVKTYTNSF